MKKILKAIGFLAVTGLFTVIFCIGILAVYLKTAPGMSVNDLTELAVAQDRNTHLYYLTSDGVAAELESETLYASQNREWVRYSQLPKNLINAFVAIEDRRFFEHDGIDLKRTAGAILGYLTGNSSYGGSTITQQLIKNVTGDDDYSVNRKIKEIVRAYKLDKELSKEEILELYLNTIYLAEKSYGVGAAADAYFDKDVSELTLIECAALACIPQSPAKWNPRKNPQNNAIRRETVLSCMEEQGLITPEERAGAAERELVLCKSNEDYKNGEHIYLWYTESVINESMELLQKHGYAMSSRTAAKLVYTGGLKIITAQNPVMQKKVEKYFANTANFYRSGLEEHPECSIVIIDPKTGNILALAGATGEKTRNRGLNYATSTLRSPGSSIKPLSVYAPGIEYGHITYGTVIDDTPVDFVKTASGYTRPWPGNYPVGYRGLTTVRDAVSRSVNTVAVKVLDMVGKQKSFELLKNGMEMEHLVSHMTINGRNFTDIAASPLALGQLSQGVTVAELTAGYTALCNGGEFHSAKTVLQILDSDGNILIDNTDEGRQLFSPQTATIMTKLLQGVTKNGTASVMDMKKRVDCAGKTGTTSGDKDRWFVGYTPDLLAGVWFGYPNPKDLEAYPAIPSPSLKTWDNIMKLINTEECLGHSPKKHFEDADGIVTARYCRDSGKLMSAACSCDLRGSRGETGYFTRSTVPSSYCTCHILVDYDTVNRAVACPECPPENVKKVGMLKLLRKFTRNVTISDAQYTYLPLPSGVEPSLISSEPFYLPMLPRGISPGRSATSTPANHYCYSCHLAAQEGLYEDEISPNDSSQIIENGNSPPEITQSDPHSNEYEG